MRVHLGAIHHGPPVNLRFLAGLGDLGDCTSPVSTFGGVPYCRDNVSGSLVPCDDPSCGAGAAAPPPSNSGTFIPAAPPTYSTQQFGNSTTTTFTLASYIAQKVQEITGQSTLSLQNQGITPASLGATLMSLAQQYCTAEGPSDCGQIGSIVAAATAQLQAAFANVPASQWNPATFTDYAYSAPASAPAYQAPQPPASTPAPQAAPQPVQAVPPAPASQPPVTSGASGGNSNTTSTSTGFTLPAFFTETSVAGIQNWVWIAGAAAAYFLFGRKH
jgi:hypothetical protein